MRISILCLFLFLQSCISKQESKPEYIRHLDSTAAHFNQTLFEEHQLHCNGYGGRLKNGISEVYLRYFGNQKYDLYASRRLIVDCLQKLGTSLNANTDLQPHLHPYPFPPEKVELSIGLLDANEGFHKEKAIAHIHATSGQIIYSTFNPSKDTLETVWQEKYAEAMSIVQTESHQ